MVKAPRPEFPALLESRRLILCPPQVRDAMMVNQAVRESFRELRAWMPWARKRPTLAETRKFCREARRNFRLRREFTCLLFLRETGELVGATGLIRGDWTVPKFEIGYWVVTRHAGNGYITEAVKTLTAFSRQRLNVRRLEIRTDAKNRRSAQVAERVGFTLEATLHRDARDNRGRLRDTLVFAKLF